MNLRTHSSVKEKTYHKNQFWAIQDSENQEAYKANLKKVGHNFPTAATYLDKIPKEQWVSYAIYEKFGIHSHGYLTNGQVDQANGKFLEARSRATS